MIKVSYLVILATRWILVWWTFSTLLIELRRRWIHLSSSPFSITMYSWCLYWWLSDIYTEAVGCTSHPREAISTTPFETLISVERFLLLEIYFTKHNSYQHKPLKLLIRLIRPVCFRNDRTENRSFRRLSFANKGLGIINVGNILLKLYLVYRMLYGISSSSPVDYHQIYSMK